MLEGQNLPWGECVVKRCFRKYIQRKFWLLILTAAITAPILPVGATPATRERHRELQQQLENARTEVRQQENLLTGTRHEMSQTMAKMQELDQQMAEIAEALESLELSLLDTQIRIHDATEAIESTRAEYNLQNEVFRSRVRFIHEQGSAHLLDVLFQAESISDFLMRWEYIRAMTEFDRNLLNRLEATENRYITLRDNLSSWQGLLDDLHFQYRREEENLHFLLRQQREWFAQLSDDEAVMAELLAIAEHEARMVESAFATIQEQLRSEEDAMSRQRAAENHNARLAALNDFNGQFQWPIPTHSRISSPFGMRMHPILRQNRMHSGIDVGAPTGTRLIAAADGYVRFAGWSGGYGNTVIIDHGSGYSTLYAHNSRNRVTTGQFVTRGQHIADVGSTGMSTGPHLHFEIRVNNVAVDPMRYFPR